MVGGDGAAQLEELLALVHVFAAGDLGNEKLGVLDEQIAEFGIELWFGTDALALRADRVAENPAVFGTKKSLRLRYGFFVVAFSAQQTRSDENGFSYSMLGASHSCNICKP